MASIAFYLNRDLIETDVPADLSVLEFLRRRRGLTGTKEGCNEGDCGACTIALGLPRNGQIEYRAVNSCLLPAPKMHGKHVVTVEGLSEDGSLHPVQRALVDRHAIQCGFCTPGMVMSLFCLFAENSQPGIAEISEALAGTLCRCTGYASIQRAALSVADALRESEHAESRPSYFREIARAMHGQSPLSMSERGSASDAGYCAPRTTDELLTVLENLRDLPDVHVVGGATDVAVDVRFKGLKAARWVDLTEVPELRRIEETGDHLAIGAGVTLSDLARCEAVTTRLPALAECLPQMCSVQIRNVATLAGNVATGSPIGDSIPVLIVYGATVVLRSRAGVRRVPIDNFYTGYRKSVRREDEIIEAVEIPYPSGWSSFEKTGKRRALDIASVSSAVLLHVRDGRVDNVRMAFGGVAPVVVRSERAESLLRGHALSEQTIRTAAQAAAEDTSPISDVRGSREFRRLLVRNHVMKHLTRWLERSRSGAKRRAQ